MRVQVRRVQGRGFKFAFCAQNHTVIQAPNCTTTIHLLVLQNIVICVRDKMRQKDREHFGIQEGGKGPLESIFSQSDFQGLAVGTYGEISSNVRKMVSIAVEYGYKHLGASILASDLDAVKNSIRRRFHTTIAMASWRGYANMLLGRIQYVGKAYAFNKVQRQYRLVEHLDQGAFGSCWSCAHLMDRPLPDLHPSGWAY